VFVTLEGIDRSGKTTQAALLREALGPDTLLLREPGVYPHNQWLGVWVESGAVGIAIAAGFALLVLSGSLIALSMPYKYYNNTAFQWKMVLLLCSVIVTLRLASKPSRILALLSLILWLSVGFSGRLIGFL